MFFFPNIYKYYNYDMTILSLPSIACKHNKYILTATIINKLSRKPKPINGIVLWSATERDRKEIQIQK